MEMFLNNIDYKKMKVDYEVKYFKLFGEYCKYDGNTINTKSASAMSEYFKNKKITLEWIEQQTTKKGTTVSTTKEITKNFYQIWSEDPEMKEYEEIVFNCNLKKVKPYEFNLFNGFNHFSHLKTEKPIDLSLIFEHIKSLTNYNEEHFEYVLNYFAQLVQQPHILPQTSIIFISEEGVGKDIFASFLGECISEKYCHNTEKLDLICGKFNSILGGKLLMIINETNPVESRDRIENLKYLITANKVTIEYKGKDAISCDNFCRFMFFSNRLFAFPVEGEGSRRPIIFNSSPKYLSTNIGKPANNKFFSELVAQYQNPNYQKAFLELLKNRNIQKFNPKEITKSLLQTELEENSVSPIIGYLASIVETVEPTDPQIIRFSSTDSLKLFNEYLTSQNVKYGYSQTKYNVELVNTYNIKKLKSCGKMLFEFNIPALKKLLETKYKYNFDALEEVETPKPSDLDGGLIYDKPIKNDDLILLQEENKQLYLEIELLKAQLLKNTNEKQEIKLADNETWSTKDDDNKSITQEDIDFLLGEPEIKIVKKIKKNKKV